MTNMFDFLDEMEVPDASESPEQREFAITDDATADWALQKVLVDRAEVARLEALAEQQKAEIDNKIAAAKERCENKTSYLLGRLAVYFDAVEHKKSKTQETYQLLSGNLVRKKGTVKTELDRPRLLDYLKEREGGMEYIKVKEDVDWAGYKKVVKLDPATGAIDMETGEVLDCITVTRAPDTFDVKGA